MDVATARDTIIRKFTNYRGDLLRKEARTNPDLDAHAEMEAMKQAAAALIDMKSFSKGRSLFRKRKEDEIMALRDQIQAIEHIPQVAAFQKAWKSLWNEADQDYWETQAVGELEDVFEYVYFCFIHIF